MLFLFLFALYSRIPDPFRFSGAGVIDGFRLSVLEALESQEHFAPQDPELFRSQERGLFRIPGTFRFPGWDSLDSHDHFVPQDP